MALTRKRNWPAAALHPFMVAHHGKPFRWGSHDCCLFAADAILALTGTDIADDFRGKYTDEAGALALIKTVTGGSTVADAAAHCASKHGLQELLYNGKPAPLLAQRGDLVVIQNGGQLIAGVVDLYGRAVSVGKTGPVQLPLRSAVRAWRV